MKILLFVHMLLLFDFRCSKTLFGDKVIYRTKGDELDIFRT